MFARFFTSFMRSPKDTDIAENTQHKVNKSILDDPNTVAVIKAIQRGTINKSLNITYKNQNEEIRKKVSKNLIGFMKKNNCEVTKRYSFDFWCSVFMANKVAYGGCLVRHHFNNTFRYGYKFEAIDIRRIDTTYNESGFINGFKYGKYNEIVAIRIFEDDELEKSNTISYDELTLYGGLLDDIHRYYPISEIKPANKVLDRVNEYEIATINTQKEAAKRGIFVRSKSFSDIAQKVRWLFGKKRSVSEQDIDEQSAKIDKYGLTIKELNSDINYIPHEDEVVVTNHLNNINYKEVSDSAKSTIASSFGIDDMTAFNKLPPSYVAALLGMRKTDTTNDIEAKNLFDHLLIDILENFIRGLQYKGILKAKALEYNFDDYNNFTYYRKNESHIDPAKTSKAQKIDMNDTEIITLEMILAEKGITLEEWLESKKRSEEALNKVKRKENA